MLISGPAGRENRARSACRPFRHAPVLTTAPSIHGIQNSVADSAPPETQWEEFEDVLKDEHIKSYLAILELDGGAGDHLFEMLVDGGHRVTSEEFVRIAMRLKGSARSQDVVSIRFDCARMWRRAHPRNSRVEL